MSQIHYPPNVASSLWIVVRPEPPGQFTARVVGLPEVQATAATRDEALQQVRNTLTQWVASGELVSLEVPRENPLLRWFGPRDPNDPLEQEYLRDLARFRQEDLERTLREDEQEDRECPSTSSTPTT